MLYVSTAVFIAPVLFNDSDCLNMEAGAVAVFLAWFNCLLFLQRYTALNQIKYLVITAIILCLYKQNHQFETLVKLLLYKKIKMAKNYMPHFCKIYNTHGKLDIQFYL